MSSVRSQGRVIEDDSMKSKVTLMFDFMTY